MVCGWCFALSSGTGRTFFGGNHLRVLSDTEIAFYTALHTNIPIVCIRRIALQSSGIQGRPVSSLLFDVT
jgi:hypothetical protein